MKFYGRDAELELLKKAVLKKPSLVLIRGRRRVGKTTLILKILEELGGVYFYIDDKKNEKALLMEFGEILKKKLSLRDYVKIERWEDFYEIIFSHGDIFVIDEFQRLLNISPSAINQLQNYWDRVGINSNTSLIISGSNVGMIKKIFMTEGAPLFKRVNSDIFLKPFTFSEARELMAQSGIKNIEDQIGVYSIFGGIPYYYTLITGIKSWREAVNQLILDPSSPLKNEVRDIMVESFGKEHASYYAVINAIAIGKTTKKEISDFSGIRESSISPYLYDLQDLIDVISYETPITEKKSWKSRRGRFVLKDNFTKFWFNYIFKNMSYYEEQNYGPIMDSISKTFDSFLGFSFESIAKEFLIRLNNEGKLPARFNKIGRWWSGKGQELDLVLISEDSKSVLLVECKWDKKTDAMSVLNSLMQKEKLIEHRMKKVYYCIVARGFKSKIPDTLCFDISDIDDRTI